MAYVLYKSGKRELVRQEKAVLLWRIHSGNLQPTTQAERRYAAALRLKVQRIVLNWHDAPDDYIRENIHYIVPYALAEWAVDSNGKPLRPASNHAWQFAKKYGLWKAHRPTPIVSGGQMTLV